MEHLWGEMDRRVSGRRNAPPPPPPTLDQLRAALLEEWDNIPMWINALMNSMHRRIRAATDTRGGEGGGGHT